MKEDRDERDAFKRVIGDELGLDVVEILDGCERHSIDNWLPGLPKARKIKKEVAYYVGRTSSVNLFLKKKPGLVKAAWHTYESAQTLRLYKDQKEGILKSIKDVTSAWRKSSK